MTGPQSSPAPNSSARSNASGGKRSVNAAATSACATRSDACSSSLPLHKEIKRGTLRGILRDADLSVDALHNNL